MSDDYSRSPVPLPPPTSVPGGAHGAPNEGARAGYRSPYSKFDVAAMRDLAFLNAMTPKAAERYMGEWIAVADGEIVAHGEDPTKVCHEGRKACKGAPRMRYICAESEAAPWLGSGGLCVLE